eukprot:6209388-Pleurochrysis_carterae.AAC.1
MGYRKPKSSAHFGGWPPAPSQAHPEQQLSTATVIDAQNACHSARQLSAESLMSESSSQSELQPAGTVPSQCVRRARRAADPAVRAAVRRAGIVLRDAVSMWDRIWPQQADTRSVHCRDMIVNKRT